MPSEIFRLLDSPRPTDDLGCWSAVTGRFSLVAGYTVFGDEGPRETCDQRRYKSASSWKPAQLCDATQRACRGGRGYKYITRPRYGPRPTERRNSGDRATEPMLVAQSHRNPPETNDIVHPASLRSSLQSAIFARVLRVL